MSQAHSNWAWTQLAQRRKTIGQANNEPCAACGHPIDYATSGRHRNGPTVDHPMQLQWGGDLLPPLDELQMMHRRCNARLGARGQALKRRTPPILKQGNPDSARSRDSHPDTPRGTRVTLEDEPLMVGLTGGMPRHFTASHPRAARSLFDADTEAWLVETAKITPLPWQRAVLTRALEVDEDGRLCWRVVIVSVGRQSGKTWLIRMLVLLRQRLFAHEEPQSILHLARTTLAARPVILNEPLVRWARSQGIYVRQSNGQEQWRWPDDSTWELSALDAAYGRTANLVMVDEVWDITRRRYFEAVQPTMAARLSAQVWMFSAAHREATELTPLMIERAREGREGYCLFDWGALDGEDLTDPEVWRAMGPHWDENRRLVIADAVGEDAFEQQWGNRWPDVLGRSLALSPFPGWGALGHVPADQPPAGALVALDEQLDPAGVGVLAYHDGCMWYRLVGGLAAGVEVATGWTDGEVLVGLSLRHAAGQAGLRHVVPYGAKETSLGLPLLVKAVAAGSVRHEHTEQLSELAAGVRVKTSDAGVLSLSVKTSSASVLPFKLASWCLWHERNSAAEVPAVW